LLSGAQFIRIRPARAGTGDPDPGARACMRAPEARGLPEGTRRKPDTDGRANPGVRYVDRVRRDKFRFSNSARRMSRPADTLVVKTSDTSHPKRGSIVPWNPSGGTGASRVSARLERAELAFRTSPFRFRPFPSVPFFDLPRRRTAPRQGGGEDVCYFVVERRPLLRCGGRGFESRGQRCPSSGSSGAATASPVPRQTLTRSVVKIADTSFAEREVAGSNPARRSCAGSSVARALPGPWGDLRTGVSASPVPGSCTPRRW
jgi:hypothetical protein